MKVIACIVFVAFVALVQAEDSPAIKAKKEAYHKECYAIYHADPALVEKAKHGEFHDDYQLKQHMFCISQKFGYQDAEGHIQYDNIYKDLKEDPGFKDFAEVERVVKKCAREPCDKDVPESVYDNLKCYWEETHKTIL